MVMIHKQTNKHTRTYKTQVRKGQSVQKTELKQTDGQTNGQTDAGYWCLTSLNTAEMISDKAVELSPMIRLWSCNNEVVMLNNSY